MHFLWLSFCQQNFRQYLTNFIKKLYKIRFLEEYISKSLFTINFQVGCDWHDFILFVSIRPDYSLSQFDLFRFGELKERKEK